MLPLPRLDSPPSRFDLKRIWMMGVMNITPDSFYEGSRFPELSSAIDQAMMLKHEGADIIDIGGESTRPGARPISSDEEVRRILPLVQALHARDSSLPLSIDTQKADVARRALASGATLINDISALRNDPAMASVIAEAHAPVVLMHMQGIPETMQNAPRYNDVVDDVKAFFEERLSAATRAGIAEDDIIFDPGIGFGKTLDHNLTLLKRLKEIVALGRPLLIGVSRKSFLGRLLAAPETAPVEERLEASIAVGLWAIAQGARALRVHDVAATRRALTTWCAVSS